MHTLTHDCDVSLFLIGCEASYDILCLERQFVDSRFLVVLGLGSVSDGRERIGVELEKTQETGGLYGILS